MRTLRPSAVYIVDAVMASPDARARAERLLTRIECPRVETVTDAELDALIERDAATMEQRIEAARKCEQAGYTVRFRFSAICPVHNWQEENRRMLDLLFANVRPAVIALETLSRMFNPTMFDNVMQADLFEPRFLDAIRGGSPEIDGKIWGPIPDREREEIHRFFIGEIRARRPNTPISLCREPRSTWDRLSDVPIMPPAHYLCTCAGDSVPGGHPATRQSSPR